MNTKLCFGQSFNGAAINVYILFFLLVLVIDNAMYAQKVGVGTTVPGARLHIEAVSNYTSAFKVTIHGSSTPHFVIEPGGKIGIRKINPNEILDVLGNIRFDGSLMSGGISGTLGQVLVSQGPNIPPQWQNASSVGDNWGNQVAITQAPIVGDGTAGNPIRIQAGMLLEGILIYNGSSWIIQETLWDSVCYSATVDIVQKWTGLNLCNSQIYDNSVNVGIGTTSPNHKFQVTGSLYVRDSLRMDGDLRPGGNPGISGQILISQGGGTPPTWQSLNTTNVNCNTIKEYGPFVNTNGDSVSACSVLMSLSQCIQACNNSTYKGFTDWRVPFIDELYRYKRLGGTDYNSSATCFHWAGPVRDPANNGTAYGFRPSDGSWQATGGGFIILPNPCRCVR